MLAEIREPLQLRQRIESGLAESPQTTDSTIALDTWSLSFPPVPSTPVHVSTAQLRNSINVGDLESEKAIGIDFTVFSKEPFVLYQTQKFPPLAG